MQEIMPFIVDNYIWFAVGGLVIIMAIIGYFADKTDFGRKNEEKKAKEPKPKKEKKAKKEDKKPEKIEVDAKGIGELTQSMVTETPTEEAPMEDLYAPLEPLQETTVQEETVDPSLYEPLTTMEVSEEMTALQPMEEVQPEPMVTVDMPATDAVAVEETSEAELQPFTPSTIEEPIEENVVEEEPLVQPIQPLEEPVQIPTEEPTATEEEDIWKF